MATDYTVIVTVRQRFGDNPTGRLSERDWGELPWMELDAPFVGASKDFSFNCPAVDPSQSDVLITAYGEHSPAEDAADGWPDTPDRANVERADA